MALEIKYCSHATRDREKESNTRKFAAQIELSTGDGPRHPPHVRSVTQHEIANGLVARVVNTAWWQDGSECVTPLNWFIWHVCFVRTLSTITGLQNEMEFMPMPMQQQLQVPVGARASPP